MRNGELNWLKKSTSLLKYPVPLYKNIDPHIFPEQPISSISVRSRIYALTSELKSRKLCYNIGSLYTLPHPSAIDTYSQFAKYNPSNLGDWSETSKGIYDTKKIEYEVIHKLIDLYRGDQKLLRGYVTTGGTEGNLYFTWLGRENLKKYVKANEICLLKSSLTHYSVRKAGIICDLFQDYIPLNEHSWNIDAEGFEKKVLEMYRKKYKGFVVPLTLGYTSTGTSDDVKSITQKALELQKQHPKINFFFWIDAALNGLILPFTERKFSPFSSPLVQGLIVDFHKFGLVPYSSGVAIYRKKVQKAIIHPVDYLEEQDSTLLGSRSGIPAISIWKMIHIFGKKGYSQQVNLQLNNKNFFIQEIQKHVRDIQIVTDVNSLTCGLIFTKKLPENLCSKYSLFPGKTKLLFFPNIHKEKTIYKIFFLPHVTREIICEFVDDLKSFDAKMTY